VAGTTLHVTVKATTNAGPIEGILVMGVPTGVDPPTNLPPGATWSPTASQVEMLTTLALSAQYTFDVVVNAPDGSTLTFFPSFSPTSSDNTMTTQALTIKVGPDATAPTTTKPTQTLATGTAMSAAKVPVRLNWIGTDAFSGVEQYQLRRQTDGGTWSAPMAMGSVNATYQYLAPNHTYRFGVRAIDHAGNVGSWTYASAFTLYGYSETSGANRYSGSWTVASSSTAYWGGKAKASSRAGSQMTRTFTGRTVAWLALRGPTRGKAQVYVNGTLAATVDLYASTTQPQRIAFTKTWSTSATRTLTIRVLGTSGRPRIDIDGILAIR
jgi:hypothetical protein